MTRTGLSNSCITVSGMNDAAGALSGSAPIFSDSCSDPAPSGGLACPSSVGFHLSSSPDLVQGPPRHRVLLALQT